jgi:hypothetical protein
MSVLPPWCHQTRKLKSPLAIFQTVSLGSWVNRGTRPLVLQDQAKKYVLLHGVGKWFTRYRAINRTSAHRLPGLTAVASLLRRVEADSDLRCSSSFPNFRERIRWRKPRFR